MIQCILFDNDGTLVDSEHLCFRAMAELFRPLGAALDPDELHARFRGWKLDDTLSALSRTHAVPLPESFVPRYRARVAELFACELVPVPHVPEVLAALGHAKAVVSSGPPEKIRQALAVTGLSAHFGANVYSSYDIGLWKPDPAIYRYVATHMGYPPDQCAVVEDSEVGVAAAADAGMRTFFLNRLGEPCPRAGVIELGSMAELPQWL